MSVINQVLKDLDRKGANASTPAGVFAVNRRDDAAPRWPWLLGMAAVAGMAVTAWWWQPELPPAAAPRAAEISPPLPIPAEPEPQLRLTQELGDVAPRQHSSVAPAAIHAHSAEGATLFRPTQAVDAVIPAAKPRLDTRLPEPRPPELRQAEASKSQVVKEIKPLTPQVLAEDAWRQATRLQEQGRNHDAQDKLESALRLDPSHAGARQSLIALVLEAGDGARAETLLREGLAQQPNDAWYARSLAQLQLQRGDAAQAAAILKTSLSKRSDAANWGLYAGTLAKLGKTDDAAQAYREALRLNPTQGNWWIGLAVALEQGDGKTETKADAGAAYQRALQTRLSNELREFAQQKVRELGASR